MLNIVITGDREVIQRFEAMATKVHTALLAEITKQALDLQAHVVRDKLQGQVLNHITGRLQSSIMHEVNDNGKSIIGRVYSNNSVNYAAIHEFGGTVPDRYPVNGKALHWMSGGQDVFAKFARGFTMPERSFLRSSLEDYKSRIIDGMTAAVQKAVGAK
jgi:HK97 gp10 family phage protein